MTFRKLNLLLAMGATLALASACGGGGGHGVSPSPDPSPTCETDPSLCPPAKSTLKELTKNNGSMTTQAGYKIGFRTGEIRLADADAEPANANLNRTGDLIKFDKTKNLVQDDANKGVFEKTVTSQFALAKFNANAFDVSKIQIQGLNYLPQDSQATIAAANLDFTLQKVSELGESAAKTALATAANATLTGGGYDTYIDAVLDALKADLKVADAGNDVYYLYVGDALTDASKKAAADIVANLRALSLKGPGAGDKAFILQNILADGTFAVARDGAYVVHTESATNDTAVKSALDAVLGAGLAAYKLGGGAGIANADALAAILTGNALITASVDDLKKVASAARGDDVIDLVFGKAGLTYASFGYTKLTGLNARGADDKMGTKASAILGSLTDSMENFHDAAYVRANYLLPEDGVEFTGKTVANLQVGDKNTDLTGSAKLSLRPDFNTPGAIEKLELAFDQWYNVKHDSVTGAATILKGAGALEAGFALTALGGTAFESAQLDGTNGSGVAVEKMYAGDGLNISEAAGAYAISEDGANGARKYNEAFELVGAFGAGTDTPLAAKK